MKRTSFCSILIIFSLASFYYVDYASGQTVSPTPSTSVLPITPCSAFGICFLVDESTSGLDVNSIFAEQRSFLGDLSFDLADHSSSILPFFIAVGFPGQGPATFRDVSLPTVLISSFITSLSSPINNPDFQSSNNAVDALNRCNYLLSVASTKILLLVTDSTLDTTGLATQVNLMKSNDVRFVVIGVGGSVDSSQLESIASDTNLLTTRSDYSSTPAERKEIIGNICSASQPSPSPSVSPSISPSISVSSTTSPSVSATISMTSSTSLSQSPSISSTTSPSPSVSLSITFSPSTSLSATPSISSTASPILTQSSSSSPSSSVTVTEIPSVTPTSSPSVSQSFSSNSSPSGTAAPTVSFSSLSSASPSNSPSFSLELFASISASIHPSSIISAIASIKISSSFSASISNLNQSSFIPNNPISLSPSSLPSVSVSISPSRLASYSESFSAISSVSKAVSNTISISPSLSSIISESFPAITTLSASKSAFPSPSASVTQSPSLSLIPMVTDSPSITFSIVPSFSNTQITSSLLASVSTIPSEITIATSSADASSSISTSLLVSASSTYSASIPVSEPPIIGMSISALPSPLITITATQVITSSANGTLLISMKPTSSESTYPNPNSSRSVSPSFSVFISTIVTRSPSQLKSQIIIPSPSFSSSSSYTSVPSTAPSGSGSIVQNQTQTPMLSFSVTPNQSTISFMSPSKQPTINPSTSTLVLPSIPSISIQITVSPSNTPPLIPRALPAGICYVIEESSSGIDMSSQASFISQKNFLLGITNNFDQRCKNDRFVGYPYRYAAFAFPLRSIFKLTSDVKNMDQLLLNGIENVTEPNSLTQIQLVKRQQKTDTDFTDAFNACESEFSSVIGNKTIFLITDTNLNAVAVASKIPEFKNLGYSIVVAGIGDKVNVTQLKEMASNEELVTKLSGYNASFLETEKISTHLCFAATKQNVIDLEPTIPSPSTSVLITSIHTIVVTQTFFTTPTSSSSSYTVPLASETPSLSYSALPTSSVSSSPIVYQSEEVLQYDPLNPLGWAKVCANVDCAECSNVLECYSNAGDLKKDKLICNYVQDHLSFCSILNRTKCGQLCNKYQGVTCNPGKSWKSCPVRIGFWRNDRCSKRLYGFSAAVRNFASYRICTIYNQPKIKCLQHKCTEKHCNCST